MADRLGTASASSTWMPAAVLMGAAAAVPASYSRLVLSGVIASAQLLLPFAQQG